jgi:SpoIIAA-like
MIRYTTQPGSPVVEIRANGTITTQELKDAITALRADFEQNGKTRVIEIIEHFTGIEPSAIWTDITLGVPLAQKVDRVAVVAEQSWVRGLAELGHLFTRAELKVFVPTELDQARAWIAAD